MTTTIRENDFEGFFEAPFSVYDGAIPFISQFKDELKGLFSAKNPMVATGELELAHFTARDAGGKLIGRVCAHVHKPTQKHFDVKTGFFGYFDCIDDVETARALHGAAQAWLKTRGCAKIIGNFNLLATQMMGVLEEGFEHQPYVAMNYSGPAIPGLLKTLGYARTFPMTTFETDLQSLPDSALEDSKQRENLSGRFRWDKARKRGLKATLEEIRVVMNDAFAKNPFFAPLTQEEFWFQAKDMGFILDPHVTSLVYTPDNALAGCIVTIPDVNVLLKRLDSRLSLRALWEIPRFKLQRDRALLLFAAVKKDMHSTGLGWTLLTQCLRSLKARGYRKLGITWVGDSNKASLTLAARIHAKPLHRLALYEKTL